MRFKQVTPPRSGLPAGDRRRIVFLVGGFVVVLAALLTAVNEARKGGSVREVRPVLDETQASPARLAVPELDVATLRAEVHDRDPADQVVLESEAADRVMRAARRYTERHYTELAAPELDAGSCAALAAEPDPARGKPFTARGEIVGLRPRSGAAHEEQFLGQLELDDGSTVHFLVLGLPAGARDLGGFVRVDGLFLKVFSSEDPVSPGHWNAGPLLVGAEAVPSFRALGPVTALDLEHFEDVEDADLSGGPDGEPRFLPSTPSGPFWELMAYARDMRPESLDWNEVPLLDQRLLDRILESPAAFRCTPARIPISRLQDGRVRVAGENPARMASYMEGWIGNTTWKNVIQFRTPVLHADMAIGDLVYGRGFFLHLFSYESAERGLRVAPVFVLQALERHVPAPSSVLGSISWFMGALAAVLILSFLVLARRDRRQSVQLQEALVRRRRARRASSEGDIGTASP